MGADLSVKVHIDIDYRNDQNEGDDFELYVPHHDGFWLTEDEVRDLRNKLDTALRAYRTAKSVIGGHE